MTISCCFTRKIIDNGLERPTGAPTHIPPQVNERNEIASNARRLLADAELLFENGRFASAVALSVIAVEEVGKIITALGLAVTGGQSGNTQALRWHNSKQMAVGFFVALQMFAFQRGEEILLPAVR